MYKKGALTDEQLVVLILAVLGIVVILVAVGVFIQRGNASLKETVCAFSTRVASRLHAGPISFPIACFEQEAKIKGDKFEVMKEIGDLMARCWWMWGEGKIPEATSGLGGDKPHICYYVTALDITGEEKEITISDFVKFLNQDGVFNRAGFSSYWPYFHQHPSGKNKLCIKLKNNIFKEDISKTGFKDSLFYIGFIDDTQLFIGADGLNDVIIINTDINIKNYKLNDCEDNIR